MALSCSPQSLLSAAQCFCRIPKSSRKAVRDHLLCQFANGMGTVPAVPTGFLFAIDPGGAVVNATWDKPPISIAYTELWTSTDNITFNLANTVLAPGASTTVAAPAAGTNLYGKIRWCPNTPPCTAFTASQAVWDAQIVDWQSRIITNGGTQPSTNDMIAANTFVGTLRSQSLFSKMLIVNVITNSANQITLATPLIKTGGSLGNDPWIVSGTGGINNTINGTQCTQIPATGVWNTGFNANSAFGAAPNSAGMTLVVSAIGGTNSFVLGCQQTAGNHNFYLATSSGGTAVGRSWSQQVASGGLLNAGFYSHSRNAANDFAFYFANTASGFTTVGTNVANEATTPPSIVSVLGGILIDATPSLVSDNRYSFLAFHLGLSAADTQNLYNAVQTLRTKMGGGTV